MKQAAFGGWYDKSDAPAQGLTDETLAASQSGAQAADRVRSKNLEVLRGLWSVPRTMQNVSEITGMPINSVCSLKDALSAIWSLRGMR